MMDLKDRKEQKLKPTGGRRGLAKNKDIPNHKNINNRRNRSQRLLNRKPK